MESKHAQVHLLKTAAAGAMTPVDSRRASRLQFCGSIIHREVFLGYRVENEKIRAKRVGRGLCGGVNFCPECASVAANERAERAKLVAQAHLGTDLYPRTNQKLMADGLIAEDFVPVVFMVTLTTPRRGGEAPKEWEADVQRFEATRSKFFRAKRGEIYFEKVKKEIHSVGFARCSDVTYQLFGNLTGPHYHSHMLVFGFLEKAQYEKILVDDEEKKQLEMWASLLVHHEWQRAAKNVDDTMEIRSPYRDKAGRLRGGVTVELARDLKRCCEYIAKNMALELAHNTSKIAANSDKHTWIELLQKMSAKNADDEYVYGVELRDRAEELYRFHASQAHRDQFIMGNIRGNETIEKYYLGSKEERETKNEEEKPTIYTHSAEKYVYNRADRMTIEKSIDVYENGEKVEDYVSNVWKKEERTQNEIEEVIKENENIVQERSAYARYTKRNCRTEKTLVRALAWCERQRLHFESYKIQKILDFNAKKTDNQNELDRGTVQVVLAEARSQRSEINTV